jgi:hypothetical protein
MLYQTYQPQSPLSKFVEVLWMREGDNLPQTQSYLLPIGSMELVINLHDDRIPRGSASFFTLPAGEFHNQRISLDEIWHSRATELRDRLLEASTWETRFLVLEKFLLMVMQPPDRYNAVNFALREFERWRSLPEGAIR